MAFSGTLDTVSLTEVLGFLEATQKSGALHVTDIGAAGTLYFRAGALSAGESGSLAGPVDDLADLEVRLLDVCCVLARQSTGSFEFEAGREPEWPEIGTFSGVELIARAERVLADWPVIEAVIPSIDARLVLPRTIAVEAVVIEKATWPIFRRVDGKTTVRELAARLKRSAFEICRDVKTLVDSGAVVIEGMDTREPVDGADGAAGLGAMPERRVRVSAPPGVERRAAPVRPLAAVAGGGAPLAAPHGAVPTAGTIPAGVTVETTEIAIDLVVTSSEPDRVPSSPYDELRSLADLDDTPNPFASFTGIEDDAAAGAGPRPAPEAGPTVDPEPAAAVVNGSETEMPGDAAASAGADTTRDRGALLRLFSGLREQ